MTDQQAAMIDRLRAENAELRQKVTDLLRRLMDQPLPKGT